MKKSRGNFQHPKNPVPSTVKASMCSILSSPLTQRDRFLQRLEHQPGHDHHTRQGKHLPISGNKPIYAKRIGRRAAMFLLIGIHSAKCPTFRVHRSGMRSCLPGVPLQGKEHGDSAGQRLSGHHALSSPRDHARAGYLEAGNAVEMPGRILQAAPLFQEIGGEH